MAGILSGVSDFLFGNDDVEKYQDRIDEAVSSLSYNPKDFYTNYQYYSDPLLEEIYQQSNTEFDNVKVDPSVLYAQNKALDELINLSESKGLNAIDQQALQEIVDAENRNLKGQQDAIMQDTMQRGVYGSGLEMAQRLQAAQSAANRMNNQDMNVMAQAQQRALDALSNYGNLASNMRGQDYNEQAKRAAAQDAINRNNINRQNDVSQKNTGIYNQQQDSNVQAARDIYGNEVTKRGLQTGQWSNNISNAINKENSDKNLAGNILVAGASLMGSGSDGSDSKKQK